MERGDETARKRLGTFMTTYGFRLFSVALHEGRSQKTYPFIDPKRREQGDYRAFLERVLPSHRDLVHRGFPHYADAIEEDGELTDRTKPLFKLLSFQRKGDHLLISVEHGRRSGHKNALADPDDIDEADLDISNHYPARTYRAALLFPTAGDAGVLAVETISRACPQAAIVKYLSKWAKDDADYRMGQEEFTYFPWWRLTAKMVGDDETRRRFVTNGAVESIRLTRYAVTADRKRLSEEFELTSKISGPDQQQDLKARVGSWFSRKQHGESVAAADAAKEVAAIVSQDVSGIEFDDVDVVIKDPETGQKKTVGPDAFSDVFVYPVGYDSEPEDDELWAAVRSRVTKLQRNLKTQFEWDGWPQAKG